MNARDVDASTIMDSTSQYRRRILYFLLGLNQGGPRYSMSTNDELEGCDVEVIIKGTGEFELF